MKKIWILFLLLFGSASLQALVSFPQAKPSKSSGFTPASSSTAEPITSDASVLDEAYKALNEAADYIKNNSTKVFNDARNSELYKKLIHASESIKKRSNTLLSSAQDTARKAYNSVQKSYKDMVNYFQNPSSIDPISRVADQAAHNLKNNYNDAVHYVKTSQPYIAVSNALDQAATSLKNHYYEAARYFQTSGKS